MSRPPTDRERHAMAVALSVQMALLPLPLQAHLRLCLDDVTDCLVCALTRRYVWFRQTGVWR